MIHNAAGRMAVLFAAIVWIGFQSLTTDTRGALVEQIADLSSSAAMAAPFEQAALPPTDSVDVVSGDVSVRVTRSNAAIDVRVANRTVWRDLGGTPQDTHYGSLGYQRVGSSTWNHVTAVSTVESIPNGQRLSVGTTETGAGAARIEITATAPGIVRIRFEPPAGQPIAREN